jgi:hypothetical protein
MAGVVGQRASASGRADGYRVWLRMPSDVEPLDVDGSPAPSLRPGETPSATPRSTPRATAAPGGPALVTIGRAVASGGRVRVEGTVTAPRGLLDPDQRLIVIQDRTGAVAVRLPQGTTVRVNDRLRVTGEVGRAYGAPRIAADEVAPLGQGTSPAPLTLREQPTAAQEWRLATISGTVERITRNGERWQAEVVVGRVRILVDGLAGAGIPAATIVKGGRITATGIVKRPHPSATDRRYTVVPRSSADVHVAAPAARPGASGASGGGAAPRSSGAAPGRTGGPRLLGSAGTSPQPETAAILDIELAGLGDAIGRAVRVGGLVVEVRERAIVVDDGSAQGLVIVHDPASQILGVLQPGDALNATGTVVADPELAVSVLDPAGLVPVSAIRPVEAADEPAASSDVNQAPPASDEAAPADVPAEPISARPAPRVTDVVLFGLGLMAAGAALLAVVRRRRPPVKPDGGEPIPAA